MPELNSQLLTLIFGGSLAGSAIYLLRAVPAKILDFLFWRFTSDVLLNNDDGAFEVASEWMSKQEFSKNARHLRLTSDYSEHEQQRDMVLSPGMGIHWFWYKNRPVFIDRYESDKSADRFGRIKEAIRIRTLGTSPKLLREILGLIAASQSNADTYVEVYLYQGYWAKVARKEKRPMASVVIPPEQLGRIIGDIQTFLNSRDWYRSLGIPYRRGILFTGPPGTGKTSLVLALAGFFGMRVYAINLGSLKGDQELIQAITSVPERSILLIEDIDVAQTKRDAVLTVTEEAPKEWNPSTLAPSTEKTAPTKEPAGITLSGLLNAIDGVFSRDGRILIMTTNYPEKLDSALKRPGRADLIEVLDELGPTEVKTMCKQYLNGSGEAFAATVKTPIAPAQLQKMLLEEHNRKKSAEVN